MRGNACMVGLVLFLKQVKVKNKEDKLCV